MPQVVRWYVFDVLATPPLLAFANALAVASPVRVALFARPVPGLLLCLAAAALWEGVAPLYTDATRDPADVVAYLLGGLCYFAVVRRLTRKRESRSRVTS